MSYNKAGLGVLLSCVLLSFAWFFWLIYKVPSVDLGEVSEGLGREKTFVLPEKYWLPDSELIRHGQQVFQTYCVTCHGAKGLGDGPAGTGLTPPPRNLVKGKWKKGGSSRKLYQTLTQGIAGTSMVSFSYLPPADRWALVHYIRSITNNKVKDDLQKLEAFAKARSR